MRGIDQLSPIQYREAVEACKDRILVNVTIMRSEYPHLFGEEHSRGLLRSEEGDDVEELSEM